MVVLLRGEQSVITFRIDGRTIKRRALSGQLYHLVPLGVGIHAYALGLVHNR